VTSRSSTTTISGAEALDQALRIAQGAADRGAEQNGVIAYRDVILRCALLRASKDGRIIHRHPSRPAENGSRLRTKAWCKDFMETS
jgi:hypothetical protein